VDVIFFQQYRAKRAQEIEPPAVEPPPLPNEEEMKAIDAFNPIHVDDEQYALLTRALRPGTAPVSEDLKVGSPGPIVADNLDKAGAPTAANPHTFSLDQPPGTPIV
jgi:hypothetical protein